MTKRNACRGNLILVLTGLVVLGAFFQGFAESQGMKQLRKAAEQGSAAAQYDLGRKFEEGFLVPQDDEEAVRWYWLAAEQGHVGGQLRLGFKYALGEGVWRKDDREAVKWWRKAAEQGDRSAQYLLGRMYYTGRGVPQNEKRAVRWYRLAAEQGHVGAQKLLGAALATECLWEILDADRQLREQAIEALIEAMRTSRIPNLNLSARKKCDLVEAYAWMLVAGAQGAEVPDELREVLQQQFMTRREVKQAQELAAELFKRFESSKPQ